MARRIESFTRPAHPGARVVAVVPNGPEDSPRMVGPFAMVGLLEHLGIEPGALPVDVDVRGHPHIGLCAITYMLRGHVTHRDSLGNRRELGPGCAGLTIGGRGVVHSERFERLRLFGGDLALIQILVALPEALEDMEPTFEFLPGEDVLEERPPGVTARWLVRDDAPTGTLRLPFGALLADVAMTDGARWTPPGAEERAAFVLEGSLRAGDVVVPAGLGLALDAGEAIDAVGPSRALVFGGPRSTPRFGWWNYLHSRLEAIEAARAAWRAGTVPLPPGDTESFTPAPPDAGRPLRRYNA